MSVLLDTDICSAHLNANRTVERRLRANRGQLYASAITQGELLTWVLRRKSPPRKLEAVESFLSELVILPVDHLVARKFGEVRARLLDAGRPTPNLDLLIACTALVHGLTVVTHNTKDFAHIPGLALEDWLVEPIP